MIFPNGLNADIVHLNLLYPKVPGGRVFGEGVVVRGWVHKEGVLPQRPRVVAGGLPLGPVQLVRELGQLLVAGHEAPVEVVMEVGSGVIIPGRG